jgi:MoaD family protein
MPLIQLYANLRKIAGTKERSTSGKTVREALNELVSWCPDLDEALLENGGLRPHVVITLNGYNVTDLTTAVTEQDVLAIFPPIAGG